MANSDKRNSKSKDPQEITKNVQEKGNIVLS